MPSFVFHLSLLIANSVHLVVGHDSFLCVVEIVHILATLLTEVLFEQFLIHTAVERVEQS